MYFLKIDQQSRVLECFYGESEDTEPGYIPTAFRPSGEINDYIFEDGRFIYNPEPKLENKPEYPSNSEKINILEKENNLLHQQLQALSDQNDFQEELIVELASIVYA